MQVRIYRDGSEEVRNLHFEAPPRIGDHVELDGAFFQVKKAWHQPDDQWAGAKLAIALGDTSEPHPGFGGAWG